MVKLTLPHVVTSHAQKPPICPSVSIVSLFFPLTQFHQCCFLEFSQIRWSIFFMTSIPYITWLHTVKNSPTCFHQSYWPIVLRARSIWRKGGVRSLPTTSCLQSRLWLHEYKKWYYELCCIETSKYLNATSIPYLFHQLVSLFFLYVSVVWIHVERHLGHHPQMCESNAWAMMEVLIVLM
jgi:hypothetical protein